MSSGSQGWLTIHKAERLCGQVQLALKCRERYIVLMSYALSMEVQARIPLEHLWCGLAVRRSWLRAAQVT